MSIRIMSAIFETEFRDLPTGNDDQMVKASSLKLVLLAIADHANDQGESAYPGLTRIQRKTGMSRQGVINVIAACKFNGLLFVDDEPSKLNTNSYTVNLECFPILRDKEDDRILVNPVDQSTPLTSTSQPRLPEVVNPVDLNHNITTKESSKHKFQKSKTDSLGGYLDLLANGQEVEKEVENILNQLEEGLRRNIPRTPQWQTLAKWIQKQDTPLETWINWYMSDVKYRAENSWRLTPEQIRNAWPQAKAESSGYNPQGLSVTA